MTATLDTIYGISVVKSPYLCDSPKFLRWRKSHRKARINKKWHKRYGYETTTCPGVAYQMGRQLMCPCVVAQMEKMK